ncbi:hypothetical protein V7147_00835 [Bacillus sp. JJ1521]
MQLIREQTILHSGKSGFLFQGTEKQANELPQDVETSTFDTGRIGS